MELSTFGKIMLMKVGKSGGGYIARKHQVAELLNLKERGLIYQVSDPLFGYTWHLTETGKSVLHQIELLTEYDMPGGVDETVEDDNRANFVEIMEKLEELKRMVGEYIDEG